MYTQIPEQFKVIALMSKKDSTVGMESFYLPPEDLKEL